MGSALRGNPTPSTKALKAAENERRVANKVDSRPSTKSAARSYKAGNAPHSLAKFPIKLPVHALTSSIPRPSTVGAASPRKDRASTAQPDRLQKPSARVGRGAAQLKQKALTTRDEERSRRVASDDEVQVHCCAKSGPRIARHAISVRYWTGLPINQRGFNIELNWMPRLNQFNQLRAHWLGNAFNLEVLIELSWLKILKLLILYRKYTKVYMQ